MKTGTEGKGTKEGRGRTVRHYVGEGNTVRNDVGRGKRRSNGVVRKGERKSAWERRKRRGRSKKENTSVEVKK